jgi:peroxiredoxin
MMNKGTRILLLLVSVCVLVFWWVGRQPLDNIGEAAPDFEIKRPDGSSLKLSDLKGKVVLLQFWGSWCGPCRRENRVLAPLYPKYNAQGFEIVSVAIERNSPAAWQKAIQTDGLNWPYHQIESGRFDGPIARLYNIHEIPATYLIDRQGSVVATHLPDDQLEAAIAAQIAKN